MQELVTLYIEPRGFWRGLSLKGMARVLQRIQEIEIKPLLILPQKSEGTLYLVISDNSEAVDIFILIRDEFPDLQATAAPPMKDIE